LDVLIPSEVTKYTYPLSENVADVLAEPGVVKLATLLDQVYVDGTPLTIDELKLSDSDWHTDVLEVDIDTCS
ncbi:MAG: hypothetical protein ACPGTP_09135, partial [Bacteroidia bacterium]